MTDEQTTPTPTLSDLIRGHVAERQQAGRDRLTRPTEQPSEPESDDGDDDHDDAA